MSQESIARLESSKIIFSYYDCRAKVELFSKL